LRAGAQAVGAAEGEGGSGFPLGGESGAGLDPGALES